MRTALKLFTGGPACLLLFFTLCVLVPARIARGVEKGWSVTGENTIRTDYFNATGDATSGPYRFEGLQSYDQFNFSLINRPTPFRLYRIQAIGVVNASDYRSTDEGVVPERINVFHERGDVSLPFRVEAGDIYAYFSFRTLQRSLKGASLEFQPSAGSSETRHSIIVVTGADRASWRGIDPADNYTSGISYLVEHKKLGRWALNFVHNTKQSDPGAAALQRTQDVVGLAVEEKFTLASQKITAEGEVSRFKGDYTGAQDRHESGLFAQLSGRGKGRYDYRFRFEKYGQDYRPTGASVPPGRRSGEAHIGWRSATGLAIRGRFEEYRTGYETANPTDTNVYGLNLSGSVPASLITGLGGSLDAFVQDAQSADLGTDRVVDSVNLNLNKKVAGGWNARLGLFYRKTDDRAAPSSSSTTRQVRLSADHAIALGGFRGNATPGVLLRKVSGPVSESMDFFPTLSVNLLKGRHSLSYDASYNTQERRSLSAVSVATFTQTAAYRYSVAGESFGVDVEYVRRNPETTVNTAAYKAGLSWRHSFERPSSVRTPRPANSRRETDENGVSFTDLSPGRDLNEVKARFAEAGLSVSNELDGVSVYETRILPDIDNRQRLALVHRGGRLTGAVIVIDFDDTGRPEAMMENFERVKAELLDIYGTPSTFFSRGDPGVNLVDDINNGTFLRVTEWRVRDGVVRFGIPRRADRQVRMEVRLSSGFPPVTDADWGLEAVR